MAAQKFKQLEKALSRLPQIGKGGYQIRSERAGLGSRSTSLGISKYSLAQSGANDDDLARDSAGWVRLTSPESC